jgi:3-oxoacyl-[acyl-carrier-protein] synthase III
MIRGGDYILLEAFGGGLNWASALIKWSMPALYITVSTK